MDCLETSLVSGSQRLVVIFSKRFICSPSIAYYLSIIPFMTRFAYLDFSFISGMEISCGDTCALILLKYGREIFSNAESRMLHFCTCLWERKDSEYVQFKIVSMCRMFDPLVCGY